MQAEMKLYGHYPILGGDNASLLVSSTLGELNALVEAHASRKAHLANATNSSLHNKVAQHLLYLAFNMLVLGMGVDLYGSQQANHYTHTHIHCFHVKMCEVFDETPLPVMGPTGFLTKGISFSPFMRQKWPEMGDLKPLNSTNLPAPSSYFQSRHPAPLLSHPILLYFHISLPCLSSFFIHTLQLNFHVTRITANTNKTATCLAFLPYLGSRKLPKAKSYQATSNQSRKSPFQPETKDFGNVRVYFTLRSSAEFLTVRRGHA